MSINGVGQSDQRSEVLSPLVSSVKRPGGNHEMPDSDGVARLVELEVGDATSCGWLANQGTRKRLKMCS